jgi:hypothetical protein
MRNNLFLVVGILLAGALGSACSFKLNVPPGQVLCKTNADCPSGATCEAISQDAAPITVSVCCLKRGCAASLTPDAVSAAVAAAYVPPQDGSASEVSGSTEAGASADALVGAEAKD